MAMPDLSAAADAVQIARRVVDTAIAQLRESGIDEHQAVAYDLAHAAAAVEIARAVLEYGATGETEAAIACAFVGDAVHDLTCKVLGRETEWGVSEGALAAAMPFSREARDPGF